MRPEEKYQKSDEVFAHIIRKPELCYGNPETMQHEFNGWRIHEDGRGGEQACRFCGLGAMEYSLRTGP